MWTQTGRQAGTGRQKNTEMYTAFTTPSQRKATAPPPPAASNTPANSGAAESFVYASDFAAPPPQTPLMEKAMAAADGSPLRSLDRRPFLASVIPTPRFTRSGGERDMLADIEEEGFKGVELIKQAAAAKAEYETELKDLLVEAESAVASLREQIAPGVAKAAAAAPQAAATPSACSSGRNAAAAAVAVPAVPAPAKPIEFDLLGLESTPSAVNTSSGGESAYGTHGNHPFGNHPFEAVAPPPLPTSISPPISLFDLTDSADGASACTVPSAASLPKTPATVGEVGAGRGSSTCSRPGSNAPNAHFGMAGSTAAAAGDAASAPTVSGASPPPPPPPPPPPDPPDPPPLPPPRRGSAAATADVGFGGIDGQGRDEPVLSVEQMPSQAREASPCSLPARVLQVRPAGQAACRPRQVVLRLQSLSWERTGGLGSKLGAQPGLGWRQGALRAVGRHGGD